MAILYNVQRLKPFLSQFKISSFSAFVQTTSRLCVCFEADLIVMGKTGHLLRYLQSNCTLPTILNFIVYYTIPYYPMLCYSMLWHARLYYTVLYYAILILYYTILYYTILYYTILYYTILYYTILYFTILCYTHTIPYYTHSIVILTRFWGDSDCLTLKLPETGILVAQ